MPQVVRRTDLNDDGAEIVRTLQKTVFANFLEVSVDGSTVSDHAIPPPPPPPDEGEEESEEEQPPAHSGIVTQNGSASVFAEGIPINRISDLDSCGEHTRITGSPNVFVGGEKKAKSLENKPPTPKKQNGSSTPIKEETIGPNGERLVTFENGNQAALDQYGNRIESTMDRNGQQLYFIQARQPYPITLGAGFVVNSWGPSGPVIYTDAVGNVLPSVTIAENSLEMSPSGTLQWAAPVVINQNVPSGDPIPTNQNKF